VRGRRFEVDGRNYGSLGGEHENDGEQSIELTCGWRFVTVEAD
jgi:hypothetical protein